MVNCPRPEVTFYSPNLSQLRIKPFKTVLTVYLLTTCSSNGLKLLHLYLILLNYNLQFVLKRPNLNEQLDCQMVLE